MLKLEEIKAGMLVTGIVPGHIARIVSVETAGDAAVTVIVKSELGVSEQQLYRSDESRLSVAEKNLPWTFVSPADDFKLALEALRIELGCAFDPMMAVLTCNEISYAVNQGDKFILALVLMDGDKTEGPYYIRHIWQNELNFGVAQETYKIADLLTKAEKPEETI